MADIETFVDMTGALRSLGRTPVSEQHLLARARRKSLSQWREESGLPPTIPQSAWTPTNKIATQLASQFITNQGSCSGCVGFSGAQANMRIRALRGQSFEKLSGAYLYAQINGGRDDGASIIDAMTALESTGTCLESTMDLPDIFMRQAPSTAATEASRFKLEVGFTISTWEEVVTAILMGFVPQFPINVGSNFEHFTSDGVAGASRGGNHSVHAIDLVQISSGWAILMPNSWGTDWGPFQSDPNKAGACLLGPNSVNWASGENDAYCHVADYKDPQDPNNVPTALVSS